MMRLATVDLGMNTVSLLVVDVSPAERWGVVAEELRSDGRGTDVDDEDRVAHINPEGLVPWWRSHRARLIRLWAIGIATSVVVTGASAMGYLEATRAKAFDFLMQFRGQRPAFDVVIVAIDDEAFESLGQRQPLPRDYLAKLLRGLERSGAAVVGLDISLTAATGPDEDAALARAITGFGERGVSRVVLPATAMPESGPLADPGFLRSVVRGSADIPQDDDGAIRRATFLVPRGGTRFAPAFSLAVAARLGGMDQSALETALRDRGGLIPLPTWTRGKGWEIDGGGPVAVRPGELWRINYVGPAKSFLTIPSRAVVALADDAAEAAPDNPLRGRVVLVGATFQESRDFFQTPHGPLPGVEIHANLVHMLVTRSFIRPVGWMITLGIQVLLVLVTGIVLVSFRSGVATVVTISGALAISIPASYLAFHRGSYWIDFMLPIVATRMLRSRAGKLERRRLRESFDRYVSREVAAQILADAPSLKGERREVSLLFSDLHGFTALSETMSPEQVAGYLNEYFDEMTSAIFRHGGMVNDFVGDTIMATFGAPLADPDHALHAAQAAVAMDHAFQTINRRWESLGLPSLAVGIGVHSGEVFAGNVGGPSRLKYAMVGDAVNLVPRVEELNEDLGTTILITDATRALLGDTLETRDRGEILLRGRNRPVRVYELLSIRADGGGPREGARA